jgi:predicted nucleotidyltransferase
VAAVQRWAERKAREHPEVVRIGYLGSYARGDWGVGSDVDLLILVEHSGVPFEGRGAQWAPDELPVPADVLVYTLAEWQSLPREGRFYRTVMREAVWVWERGTGESRGQPEE